MISSQLSFTGFNHTFSIKQMTFKLSLLKKYLLFLFIFFVQINFAQENINIKKGDYFYKNYRYDSAYIYYQKAIPQIKKSSSLIRGNFFIKYGKSLKAISKADSAYYYLEVADKIFSKNKSKNQEQLFYIKTLKAETARYLDQKDKSIKSIHEAQLLYKPNYDPDKIAYYLNRKMAITASHYGNLPDSVKVIYTIYNKILKLENQIQDKSIIVYSINEIAYLDFNSNPKNAYKNFKKAFDIAEKYNAYQALIDVSKNIGMYFQQKETNFAQAIKYHKIALKYAKKINNLSQIEQAYFNLRCCYHLSNSLEKAIYYTDSTILIKLIIKENENTNLLKEFEIKNNIEKKEQELKESKKINYLILIILVVVVIGLFVLFYYNNKINKKNKKLAQLHQENNFLLRETNHRVNNNLQLISLLISETIRKKHTEENKTDFKKLLSKVETIASLHRHLYLTKNNDKIDLKNYLFEVKNNFNDLAKEKNIEIIFTVDFVEINPDDAMYLGLLITELIINSVKHAFDETQEKNIHLFIELDEECKELELEYFDNGALSKGKNINPKLVNQLCQQLAVHPIFNSENGFTIKFTKKIEA